MQIIACESLQSSYWMMKMSLVGTWFESVDISQKLRLKHITENFLQQEKEKRSISDTFNKATGICASETTNQNRPPLKAVNTPRPVPVTVPSSHSSKSSALPLVNINDLD